MGGERKIVGVHELDTDTRGGMTWWGLRPKELELMPESKPEVYLVVRPKLETHQERVGYFMLKIIRPDIEKPQTDKMIAYYYTSSIPKDIAQFAKPMNTARPSLSIMAGDRLTIYEQMQRGNFGTPEQFWKKFGLGNAYRRKFSSDSQFWQSDKSLVEIYLELRTI
jgi:hypothetical protein